MVRPSFSGKKGKKKAFGERGGKKGLSASLPETKVPRFIVEKRRRVFFWRRVLLTHGKKKRCGTRTLRKRRGMVSRPFVLREKRRGRW